VSLSRTMSSQKNKKRRKYHRLNLNDILNVLCHYDLKHIDFPINRVLDETYMGLADDSKREILIYKSQPYEEMRETVLHEMYHHYHNLKGDLDGYSIDDVEDIVDKETKRHLKLKEMI